MKIDDLRRCLALVEEASDIYPPPPWHSKQASLESSFEGLIYGLTLQLRAVEKEKLNQVLGAAGYGKD